MSERTRLETITAWIAWHFGELAAVAASIAVAVYFTWWFLIGTAVIVAVWTVQERRTRRAHAPRRVTGRPPQPLSIRSDSDVVLHVVPREGA